MIITIADINGRNEHDQFNNELVDIISKFILENKLSDFRIYLVKSFVELATQIIDNNDKHIIFSNFPPDSTYEKDAIVSIKEGVRESVADSYSISKSFVEKLLEHDNSIHWHIITGAPRAKLTDSEVMNLNPKSNITLKRKHEWINSGDFYDLYPEYILDILQSSFIKQ